MHVISLVLLLIPTTWTMTYFIINQNTRIDEVETENTLSYLEARSNCASNFSRCPFGFICTIGSCQIVRQDWNRMAKNNAQYMFYQRVEAYNGSNSIQYDCSGNSYIDKHDKKVICTSKCPKYKCGLRFEKDMFNLYIDKDISNYEIISKNVDTLEECLDLCLERIKECKSLVLSKLTNPWLCLLKNAKIGETTLNAVSNAYLYLYNC